MQEEKVEGIVLRCQEYKEQQRIVTLFTQSGILSLIVKGISPKNARLLALTTPFSHGEYHVLKKSSDLLSFQDGVVLNEHLELRHSLQALKTAGALAQAILRSQWPGKASSALFALYKAYHGRVHQHVNWRALLASFYIKLLHLEGVLVLPGTKEELLAEMPGLCSLFPAEQNDLLILGKTKHFSSLEGVVVTDAFLEKVEKLFLAL